MVWHTGRWGAGGGRPYGTEVGRARQLDIAERVLVGANHVLDADALGLVSVHIIISVAR